MAGWTLPDHCPPSGHVDGEGDFYRLTNAGLAVGDCPPAADWTLPIDKRASEAYQRTDRCDAYAHSIFTDIEVLRNARRALGWARRKTISRVTLSPGTGRLIESPSDLGDGHRDWWPDPLDYIPPCVVVEAREDGP